MSVILQDVSMPDMCSECDFCGGLIMPDGIYTCERTGHNITNSIEYDCRNADCPLVEVPPHGRLIDKDKLRRDLFLNFNGERIPFYDCDNFPTTLTYRDLHSILAEQPTIIEAEGSEE